MKEVEVGHHSVLLTRYDGKYSALGNQCTHYGAPLSQGVVLGNRVRCPWHGSCFNICTGDLEEFPGIDSLPCHKAGLRTTCYTSHDALSGNLLTFFSIIPLLFLKVKIQNSKVYVTVNNKDLRRQKRIRSMGAAVPGVTHTILLLGGGIASLMCAETLRQEKFGGRIIMVSRDHLLPYDKTRLSKVMNVESDTIVLRRMEFYHQYDIEVWLRKEALSVDTEKKTVTFDDGLVQNYDQLLISTGCRAKALDVPGTKLDNIKMLETPEDARQIHAACTGSNVVLVGTSFVGMEVASYLLDKAFSITVIGSSELPYQNTLGREVGRITMMMLSENNVKFYMNDMVTEIKGVNGKVKEVVLKSGKVIPTDVLIVGIGSIPNSEFLQGTKIQMNQKKLVIVDKYMRTNVPDVFCAGDLASFPLPLAKNKVVNIGHWQMAQAQGRVAALNMLGKETELTSVPFYWTVLLGKTIRYAGYGEGYTELVMKGNIQEHKFLALYLNVSGDGEEAAFETAAALKLQSDKPRFSGKGDSSHSLRCECVSISAGAERAACARWIVTLVSRDADVITLPADRSGKPGVRVDWACECVRYRGWEGVDWNRSCVKRGAEVLRRFLRLRVFSPPVDPNALRESTQRHTQPASQPAAGTPPPSCGRGRLMMNSVDPVGQSRRRQERPRPPVVKVRPVKLPPVCARLPVSARSP
ncbi:Apoptosis-inducing factor 3 [Oryzias melastigma]|uniref:Apoptosis-inducing factor 3 n=1 Tax=Oryzias melastigma TaxID=30732 RepID=A0A834BT55_ORYME|nr:Apoptosis-inducing factor 3 [Oryzias melastigma]